MLSHIKRYVDLGFVVHPLCPPTHVCQSPGKIPFDPVLGRHMTGWQNHGQFSCAQWQEWIDYDSEINVGFLTGSPSGLVCLDIDDNEGLALVDELEIDIDTWQYRTGRGLRLLYRHINHSHSGIISGGGASIEVLGDGRQSVLPPSVHPNGKQYEWVVGRTPRSCRLSSETSWLDFRGGNGGLDGLNSDETDWTAALKAPPRKGERNVRFTSIAGHLMSPGSGMSKGEASFWLKLYNRSLPDPLDERELASVIHSIHNKEQRTVLSGERDIKRIMVERCVSWDDAKMIWQSME